MNTTLVAVAILAVAVAVAALIALGAAYRRERRRSDARVALLQELSGRGPAGEIDLSPLAVDEASEREEFVAKPMFRHQAEASPWGRRAAAALVVAVLAAALGYAWIPRAGRSNGTASEAATLKQATPLELLSLRHNHDAGKLIVTGLVQNPRTGLPLTNVIATAFLFAADGTFLASGRAPLDFSKLAPGDESPFVIDVPVSGTVARYRVGFRGEDGRVIAHVDRRTAGTLAQTVE